MAQERRTVRYTRDLQVASRTRDPDGHGRPSCRHVTNSALAEENSCAARIELHVRRERCSLSDDPEDLPIHVPERRLVLRRKQFLACR